MATPTLPTSTDSTTAPHDFDSINADCEMMDLRTAVEMLLNRLDDVCAAIINDDDVFGEWEQAHWIALRMKNDIQRIQGKMVDEANARHEGLRVVA